MIIFTKCISCRSPVEVYNYINVDRSSGNSDGRSFTIFVRPNHVIPSLRFLQQQAGGTDCGLFVLAFAYTSCAGAILEKMT